jgi:hypothetical protein
MSAEKSIELRRTNRRTIGLCELKRERDRKQRDKERRKEKGRGYKSRTGKKAKKRERTRLNFPTCSKSIA